MVIKCTVAVDAKVIGSVRDSANEFFGYSIL